jgi:class 3 adenylate cyclase
MTVACANCGTEPREGARFCDSCGFAITASTQPPEYKQVTVLFADVVRSMEMASTLGTERLREVMSELLSRSRTVVTRYGGTVDFTGDGIMALFGAPIALEDHAFRGCLAALELQEQARAFADELLRCDDIQLQLRVGLNSGEVIAGEMGSTPGSYTAIGAHVGMAQRMESIAPAGGVMLSASTARLVEGVVETSKPEMVRIKNVEEPVPARRLLSVAAKRSRNRVQSTLVGRDREVNALSSAMDEALGGRGAMLGIVGPPGIGKSRLVAELCSLGAARGFEVVSAFCEAHAREVPFYAAARLFREVTGVGDLREGPARERVRARLPGAHDEDLLLLDDLLAIGDAQVEPPAVGPDARRRRLVALLNAATLARDAPVMFVVEDAHWIDEASESLVAEFFSGIGETHALALVTYRPEYRGRLAGATARSVALAPLDDSHTTTLIGELLGGDPSVVAMGAKVAERAGGNPFFAEEMVRDLAERGVLHGRPGAYAQRGDAADIHVPATLQATIAARIDRLGAEAKRTLNAAAVVGARFAEDELESLVESVCIAELLAAELIDEVTAIPRAEYVFRHPMIRSVAYESQLRSSRAELHRRLATALEHQGPGSLDENAALIAMHVEAAGDLRSAFDWHMRAGTWLTLRNIVAARTSWQRARRVAEQLPVDDADRLRMRVDAGTLLCGSAWRAGLSVAETGFDELRQLCAELGDQRSLAIGMSGMVIALAFHNRPPEASMLASDLSALIERIDDPAVTMATSFAVCAAKWETGEIVELSQMARRVIDLAAGDPDKGNLLTGSPLSLALSMRGVAAMCQGRAGWKADLDRAIEVARASDPLTRVIASLHKYAQIGLGALVVDDQALRDTAEVLAIAEHSGDDFVLSHAHLARGITLVRHEGAERESGFEHLRRARGAALDGRGNASIVQIADIQLARRQGQLGELNNAIELSGAVLDELFDCGSMLWRGPATTVLVEALLDRSLEGDVSTARAAIERLAAVPTDAGYVLHDVPLLRLRALVAKADGDDGAYLVFAAEYRAMADMCGFEGHQAIASSMT